MTYGLHQYVAAVLVGRWLTSSEDGIHWLYRAWVPWEDPQSMTCGAGTFVVVGRRGAILTSANGSDWTNRRRGGPWSMTAVAFANDTFVAAGEVTDGGGEADGVLMTSNDGRTWIERTTALDHCGRIGYGNGTFVAVGGLDGGWAMTSPDGIAWSGLAPVYGAMTSVVYGAGQFVAVGQVYWWAEDGPSGAMNVSTDGRTWKAGKMPFRTPHYLADVAFGAGTFVAVGNDYSGRDRSRAVVISSTDGLAWYRRFAVASNYLSSVAYGNARFVATGPGVLTSQNGIAWSESPAPSGLSGLTFAGGRFLAVAGAAVATSVDGLSWTLHPTGQPGCLTALAQGQGRVVAVGPDGLMLRSDRLDLPRLDLPVGLGTEAVRLRVWREPGQTLTLQASTNLLDWWDVTTDVAPTVEVEFFDQPPSATTDRFYRTASPRP